MDIPHSTAPAAAPVYRRATEFAKRMGVDNRIFVDECLSGRLPIRVRLIGAQRTAYVVVADVRRALPELEIV